MEKIKNNSTARFLIEALLVLMLTFACGCGSMTDSRSLIGGGAGHTINKEEIRDHYDAKSGTYVTESQYKSYRFMDIVLKRGFGALTLLLMVISFVFRRLNHQDAVLRSKALCIELGFPVIYLTVIYVGSYFMDNPIF